MAGLQVFQHKRDGSIFIVPFALAKEGGAMASGATVKLTRDAFGQRGGEVLTALLHEFYTRDRSVPSELYNQTPPAEREAILQAHKRISLHWNRRGPAEVTIYKDDDTKWTARRLPFPGEAGLLASAVLQVFDQC